MGKTYRKNSIDTYGCFEKYSARKSPLRKISAHVCVHQDIENQHTLDTTTWAAKNRDGKPGLAYAYGKENRRFKKNTVKIIRNKTLLCFHKGMREGDWDSLIFPTQKEGLKFSWNF
jgi:hypothetical protein